MPSPQIVEEAAKGSQLVGLRVNSGWSADTRTSRTFSGMPLRMWGIGSEAEPSTSPTWVTGLRRSASRTTIVPASKGPATAGTIATALIGSPW